MATKQAPPEKMTLDRSDNSATIELYRAALGPLHVDYYLKVFARFDSVGKAGPSWNWAAALLTLNWMALRGLWGQAMAYAGALTATLLFSFGLLPLLFGLPQAGRWGLMGLGLLLIVAVPGALGNAWFYAACNKAMGRAYSGSTTLKEACALLQQGAPGRRRLGVLLALNLALCAALAAIVLYWPSSDALTAFDSNRMEPARVQPATLAVGAAGTASAASAAGTGALPIAATVAALESARAAASAPAAATATAAASVVQTASVTASGTAAGASPAQPLTAVASAPANAMAPASASPTAPAKGAKAGSEATALAASRTSKGQVQADRAAALLAAAPAVAPSAKSASATAAAAKAAGTKNPSADSAAKADKRSATPAARKAAQAEQAARAADPAKGAKEAKAAKPDKVAKPAPAAETYLINVGLFADTNNALNAYTKLMDEDLPALSQQIPTSKGPRTRVRVGPFETFAEADAAAEKIRALKLEAVIFKP